MNGVPGVSCATWNDLRGFCVVINHHKGALFQLGPLGSCLVCLVLLQHPLKLNKKKNRKTGRDDVFGFVPEARRTRWGNIPRFSREPSPFFPVQSKLEARLLASPVLNGFRITPRHCAALDLRGYPGHLRWDSISCSSPQNCTLCTLLVGKISFFALLPSAAAILAK